MNSTTSLLSDEEFKKEQQRLNLVLLRAKNIAQYFILIGLFGLVLIIASIFLGVVYTLNDKFYPDNPALTIWALGFTIASVTGILIGGNYLFVNSTISRIDERTLFMKEDLTKLNTSVDLIKSDVGTLKSDVGTLKSDVGTLKSDVGSIIQTLSRIEARLQ
jgi:hypothetical protein